jgi:hypothetical protein
MLALKEEKFILLTFFISSKRKPPTSFFKKFYYKSPGAFGIIVEITIDRALLHKPFYTDVFYLHSLWSYLPRLWSQLQRLVEIKQAGRKPLTIRRERVRDMDKIF